jgi:excisionase family DNA binding protein
MSTIYPVNGAASFPGGGADPLLDSKAAAQYLGVTVHTMSIWRCTGRYKIPFVKVGRLVKYKRSALEAFVSSRTKAAGTEKPEFDRDFYV